MSTNAANSKKSPNNPLDALFEELKHAAATDGGDAAETLERRDVLNSVWGTVVDAVGPVSLHTLSCHRYLNSHNQGHSGFQ